MKLSAKGGVSHPSGGIAGLAGKVSRDRGYRSDTIAIPRDMGPLRLGSSKRHLSKGAPLNFTRILLEFH